ncbi:MAG TPA: ATP-binding protein [Vicinamibacterales bacterium]|nr:ATP-binding protein [Vicinamibacterales bacterium]
MPTLGAFVPRPRSRDGRLLALAGGLTVAIFALDLWLPLGVGACALYGVVILFGLFVEMRGFALWAAAGATLLTTLTAALSPAIGIEVHTIVNRALTIVGIWVTAWLVSKYSFAGRALNQSIKDLADTNFALNQAAIVATTDVKGKITFVNEKFVEISKYSREELIGRDHRIINSGYHSKEFIRDLWHTIANGRIWRGELRNRAKDGSIYWVDTTIVPFLDEQRKPYQYMAIRYDITDRKRSESQLREQAALARLGEMAAVVAHEVKNPLAAIKGALQVIGGRIPATTRDRAIIGDIVARVDSLNDIVQDLLVFARPRDPQLGPVALADLLESTAALLRKDPTHGSLQIEISGGNPIVQADIEQLRTVFLNLLLNAAQASGASGRLAVSIAADDLAATVSIADNGPGIPDEIRAKIFEPFFTTKHRGTGLGLPTARRVVERHRGVVEIDCPAGGGTVVSVTLPMQ